MTALSSICLTIRRFSVVRACLDFRMSPREYRAHVKSEIHPYVRGTMNLATVTKLTFFWDFQRNSDKIDPSNDTGLQKNSWWECVKETRIRDDIPRKMEELKVGIDDRAMSVGHYIHWNRGWLRLRVIWPWNFDGRIRKQWIGFSTKEPNALKNCLDF